MEKSVRVLIADAAPDQTILLRDVLEDAGFTVTAAVNDGETAYDKVVKTVPDVLVTDLLLPRLDGLSLLRRLKEENILPPTVILSAFWNDRMARCMMRLGVGEYLPKPCSASALFQRIRALADAGCESRHAVDPAIRRALLEFHVPSHLDGYQYLCEGLSRVLEDPQCLQGVTKSLYRDIARVFHTNQACVERSMRTAVMTAWQRGSAESRRRSFGAVFDGYEKAPSNIRFMGAIAEYISLSDSISAACR